ncbi:MAG TPA: hypothetical protein VMY78_13435 [Solirubrobacteraceae bacterium]|nr:hypothetical protein [Solirubrobacteraceae bacterium]
MSAFPEDEPLPDHLSLLIPAQRAAVAAKRAAPPSNMFEAILAASGDSPVPPAEDAPASHRNERDRIVNAACSEGRFPRSRMGQYLALYDRDPAGTRVLLTAAEDRGGLAKGLPQPLMMEAEEPLPDHLSLLTPDQRAALRARRAA